MSILEASCFGRAGAYGVDAQAVVIKLLGKAACVVNHSHGTNMMAAISEKLLPMPEIIR